MQIPQFRRVLHVVGIDFRVFLFHVSGVVTVLVDENGPPVMVESFPQKGLLGEPEYKEIAWGGAFSEDIRDLLELRIVLFVVVG